MAWPRATGPGSRMRQPRAVFARSIQTGRAKGDGAAGATSELSRPPLLCRSDPDYKLWIRLKAAANSWANDSVWVQFSGATDVAGVQKFQIDTTSGLAVNLEECSGCGVSGWGWKTTAGARRTPMACCFGSRRHSTRIAIRRPF